MRHYSYIYKSSEIGQCHHCKGWVGVGKVGIGRVGVGRVDVGRVGEHTFNSSRARRSEHKPIGPAKSHIKDMQGGVDYYPT